MIKIIFVALLTWGNLLAQASPDLPRTYVLKVDKVESAIALLRQQGMDVLGVSIPRKEIEVILPHRTLKEMFLRQPSLALRWQVLQESVPVFAPLSGIGIGPIDEASGYKSYEQLSFQLQRWAETFPDLVKLESLGLSTEGRNIWAVTLTASKDPGAPVISFTGMHHAREVMSVEVPLDIIEFLLNGYGQDPWVTTTLDSKIITVIPMVNPDGNRIVWNGNRMWRKNNYRTPGSQKVTGVDLNRNYEFQWGTCNGSSGSPSSDTYRGPKAGSEPETQAIKRWATKARPVSQISYHSFSELVLYPYGCTGDKEPDSKTIVEIGEQLAKKLVRDDGKGTYAPGYGWELLYGTDGDDTAWLYGALGVFGYVVELNDRQQGFHPSFAQWREGTVKRNRPGWRYLIDRVDGPGLELRLTDSRGQPIPNAIISVKGLAFNKGEAARITNQHGRFYYQTLPGQFELEVNAGGYGSRNILVDVGTTRQIVSLQL